MSSRIPFPLPRLSPLPIPLTRLPLVPALVLSPLITHHNFLSRPGPASSTDPQVERKPFREANIAERRVRHNAVERKTSGTQQLNGRFRDLAAPS
jgi:hypothetical protein